MYYWSQFEATGFHSPFWFGWSNPMGQAKRQNLQIHPSWLFRRFKGMHPKNISEINTSTIPWKTYPPFLRGGGGSWGLAVCSDKSKTWQTKGGIEKHGFSIISYNFKGIACKARCLIMNLKSLIVYCSGSIVIYLYVLWTKGKRLSTWRLTWRFQVDFPFRSKRLNYIESKQTRLL